MDRIPFRFTGTGQEYFNIWLRNLVLNLITLGFYSPWAKVRKQRYFYQNTHIGEGNFDYHGDPIAILKGRLVALALLLFFNFVAPLNWQLYLATLAAAAVLVPWLICRSLKFRLKNTSFNNIRFNFRGTTGEAFRVYLFLPILSLLTLFLLFPYSKYRSKEFLIGESALGRQKFSFETEIGDFYKIYVVAGLTQLAFFIVLGIVLVSMGGLRSAPEFGGWVLILVILTLLAMTAWRSIVGLLQNFIWNSTKFHEGTFDSKVNILELFDIHLGNLLLSMLTLGLYRPFAEIRLIKYQIERMTLVTATPLQDIVAQHEHEIEAVGEEITDIFDIDISL